MRKESKIAIENNLLDKILENRKSNESISEEYQRLYGKDDNNEKRKEI